MQIAYSYHDLLPDGARVTPLRLVAGDDSESWALLAEPAGGARTALYLAHPRAAFSRHYLVPGLLRAGVAVFGHDLRSVHNDTEAQHEKLLLDVAAGMRAARRRYQRVVLLGNSGGGALLCAFQARARASQGDAGDGFIAVAAHPGEGRWLMQSIDPSVTDESDPLSCDPELDMFNPANGYDLPTRTARYRPEWLSRYREAQRARVARLDEIARGMIDAQRAARAGLDPSLRPYPLIQATRRAIPNRLMVVHRTVANPALLDLAIDPSDRDVGSIFGLVGDRPEFGNYFELNVARVLAPRAWLSSWSGLSSKVDFAADAAALDVPVLFVTARGDSEILPADAAAMWSAIGAADRTRHDVDGADHYFRPVRRRPPARDPRAELLETIVDWLRARA